MKHIKEYFRRLLSMYAFDYAACIAKLCSANEYHPKKYIQEFWRTQDFRLSKKRSTNKVSKVIEGVVASGMYAQVIAGVLCAYYGYAEELYEYIYFGIAIIVAAPVVWAHVVWVLLVLRVISKRVSKDLQA